MYLRVKVVAVHIARREARNMQRGIDGLCDGFAVVQMPPFPNWRGMQLASSDQRLNGLRVRSQLSFSCVPAPPKT